MSPHTVITVDVSSGTRPAALDVPPHVHEGEDEMFYVLAGDLAGLCADQRWSASPGALVFLPRDTEHSFTVTSRSDAEILVVVGPPRFDAHVAERDARSV